MLFLWNNFLHIYYLQILLIILNLQNIKNHPNLRVHFIFENEKLDYCAWGYEIPMEEAEEVVKKIKEFLKKRNNNELE